MPAHRVSLTPTYDTCLLLPVHDQESAHLPLSPPLRAPPPHLDKGHVLDAVHRALVAEDLEGAPLSGQPGGGRPANHLVPLPPIPAAQDVMR